MAYGRDEAYYATTHHRVEADPAYWPLLRRLLATGQLEAAGELLLAHPAYAADASGGGATVRFENLSMPPARWAGNASLCLLLLASRVEHTAYTQLTHSYTH